MSWLDKALCAELEIPTEYFFDEYIKDREVFNKVNEICSRCPVRAPCLRYGMNTKSVGVWGGAWLQYGNIVDVVYGEEEEG